MKHTFDDSCLYELQQSLEAFVAKMSKLIKPAAGLAVLPITKTPEVEKAIPIQKTKSDAARTIQMAWRKHKVKQRMVANPFMEYLSYIDPKDEKRVFQTFMFGRHIAEIGQAYKDNFRNPSIDQEASYYHRDTNGLALLSRVMNKSLYHDILKGCGFNSEQKSPRCYDLIPINILANEPIDQFMAKHFPYKSYEFHRSAHNPIGVLELVGSYWFGWNAIEILAAAGLTATQWNLASLITDVPGAAPKSKSIKVPTMSTKKRLLESDVYRTLKDIAADKGYPTQKLAASLQELIEKSTFDLTPGAISRISLMLNITTLFYRNNYSRFAFCVYTIMHEMSLALRDLPVDDPKLIAYFKAFEDESIDTLKKIMGVNPAKNDLSQVDFIALPAISGTNAYGLAMKIASKMKVDPIGAAKIYVEPPAYYEFQNITPLNTGRLDAADILVISASPIIDMDQMLTVSGTDINAFIKKHSLGEKKPVTLIVDLTTALHQQVTLEPEVQQLVLDGKLSIIFHESHQKFGQLHCDQAQFGRTFGVFSKKSFACDRDALDENNLYAIKQNGFVDYTKHLDLRVGSYISSSCGGMLEEIKKQHFSNGAIFRELLTQKLLKYKQTDSSDDSIPGENVYFVSTFKGDGSKIEKAVVAIIPARDSFGHYNTTRVRMRDKFERVSPGASDDIDCLLEATSIYLSAHLGSRIELPIGGSIVDVFEKFNAMVEGMGDQPLTLDKQILLLSFAYSIMANHLGSNLTQIKTQTLSNNIKKMLDRCTDLTGRVYYQSLYQYRQEIQKTVDTLSGKHAARSKAQVAQPGAAAAASSVVEESLPPVAKEIVLQDAFEKSANVDSAKEPTQELSKSIYTTTDEYKQVLADHKASNKHMPDEYSDENHDPLKSPKS